MLLLVLAAPIGIVEQGEHEAGAPGERGTRTRSSGRSSRAGTRSSSVESSVRSGGVGARNRSRAVGRLAKAGAGAGVAVVRGGKHHGGCRQCKWGKYRSFLYRPCMPW
jgi:hypothetical protein